MAQKGQRILLGNGYFPLIAGASINELIALEFTKQLHLPSDFFSRVLFKIKLDHSQELNPILPLNSLSIKPSEQEVVFTQVSRNGFNYRSEFLV